MKVLRITEEVEKILISLFDAALKSGGFSLHAPLQRVISSLEDDEPCVKFDEVQKV